MIYGRLYPCCKNYLNEFKYDGSEDCSNLIYGSQITGRLIIWSDIDNSVVSSLYDHKIKRSDVNLLWHKAASQTAGLNLFPRGKCNTKKMIAMPLLELPAEIV